MNENLYKKLSDAIMRRASSMPVINCPEFEALITELFKPEQAEVAIHFPKGMHSAKDLASVMDRPVEEVEPVIESMAADGFVFTSKKDGDTLYRLMDVLPGFFEFQFMKGGTTDRDKRIAKLFDDYFDKLVENINDIPEPFKKVTKFSRVIPVDKEIAAGNVIHPYETVSEYIDKSDYISVSPCYCRHHRELTGDPCEHTKNTCMAFGPSAKHVIDYGFGEQISKEEAKKLLDDIEEEGLIHISSNTSKYIDFMCNCCSCHCGVIKSFKESDIPVMGVISNFELHIDEENCTGCNSCVEKCPVDALALKDDIVHVDRIRCIGCGVCNISCDTKALSMKRRENAEDPPFDRKDLSDRIMKNLQDAIKEVEKSGAGE